jgi:hypothetical protein
MRGESTSVRCANTDGSISRHDNATLEKKAAKLVDDRGAVADEPAANPMQRLKIELLRALDRHKSHGRSLHCLCNGLGVAIVVLLPFAEGLYVLSWDQPNVMTKGRESTTNVVCTGAGFDPHETWLEVSHVPLQSPPRQLLAHDHFPTRIHSNEVKATLAEIHSDCSDTVIVRTGVSHGALPLRISCGLQHCHSLGRSAAGPYHYLG